MSRRLRIAHQRRLHELQDPESAISRSTDPERDQYARVKATTDPRPDREPPNESAE